MAEKSGQSRQPFRAQKTLGQHWLVDNAVIQAIVNAVLGTNETIERNTVVLEIGPGQGAITDYLAQSGATILAIDLDKRAVSHLKERYADNPNIQVEHGDILALTPEQFVEKFTLLDGQLPEKLAVVGNLPYQITNRIIRHFCGDLASGQRHPWRDRLAHLTIMIQKEVAERLVAEPSTKAYSMLTLGTQRVATVMSVCPSIPPTAFRPPPKVHSAVVQLTPREEILYPDVPSVALQRVVQASFQQRRKVLRNSLGGLVTKARVDEVLEEACQSIEKPPAELASLRPETLSLWMFGELAKAAVKIGCLKNR
jgi:16S rRNA (adenine1518-N6/adenine1519-N6)-dimethyltransferase